MFTIPRNTAPPLTRWLLTALLGAMLAGCASSPTKQPPRTPPATQPPPVVEQPSGPTASQQLATVRLHLAQDQIDQATASLGQVNYATLNPDERFTWFELQALVLIKQNALERALWLLTDPAYRHLAQTPEQRRRLAELNALASDEPANPLLNTHSLASMLAGTADPTERQALIEAIWHAVSNLSPDQLARQLQLADDLEIQGWLYLAMAAASHSGPLERQLQNLQQWRDTWQGHPAEQSPPAEIAALAATAGTQASSIGLLLPLSGRLSTAGSALRDAITTAYYEAGASQQLKIYDTQSADITALYAQAIADGMQAVIGPLDKDRVNQLAQLPAYTIPVLALNYVDSPQPTAPGFYQFGLSADDEARFAARVARQQHLQQALVMHSNSDWSQRAAEAFASQWQADGGRITAISNISEEASISANIKAVLQLDLSDQRKQRLARTLAQTLDANPYRRQDIDLVFIAANPAEGRSIKPILAYHFASDLPVYATGNVYSSDNNPNRNADLNGIQFAETPWALGSDSTLKTTLESYNQRAGNLSKNLPALGIDAFYLVDRLALLQALPQLSYAGYSGALQVDSTGVVRRQPAWAVFTNGQPKPQTSPVLRMEANHVQATAASPATGTAL